MQENDFVREKTFICEHMDDFDPEEGKAIKPVRRKAVEPVRRKAVGPVQRKGVVAWQLGASFLDGNE